MKGSKQLHCSDPKLFPFIILQKIMAFDYKCKAKLDGSFIKKLSPAVKKDKRDSKPNESLNEDCDLDEDEDKDVKMMVLFTQWMGFSLCYIVLITFFGKTLYPGWLLANWQYHSSCPTHFYINLSFLYVQCSRL